MKHTKASYLVIKGNFGNEKHGHYPSLRLEGSVGAWFDFTHLLSGIKSARALNRYLKCVCLNVD